MVTKQINAHVIPRIKKRFGDYAAKNGLDDSVVAKLLILPGERIPQIAGLRPHTGSPRSLQAASRKVLARIRAR